MSIFWSKKATRHDSFKMLAKNCSNVMLQSSGSINDAISLELSFDEDDSFCSELLFSLVFLSSGFSLILCPTKVKDFYNDEEVSSIYYPEMHEVVKKETGANQVQIISHITRNEEEAAQGKRLGAHRLVHNDFTPQFQSIVDEFLKEAKNKPSRVVVYN